MKKDDNVRNALIVMRLSITLISFTIGVSTGIYALYMHSMLLFFDIPLPPNIIMAPIYMAVFLFLGYVNYKGSTK